MRAATVIPMLALSLMLMTLVTVAGCDEGLATESAPPPNAPTAAAPSPASGTGSSTSLGNQPNSAPGGAKCAAERTAKSLEGRQEEIAREIDRQLEDD